MPQVKCKICGKEFYAKPSHLKRGWGKYCSQKCQYKGLLRGKFVNCAVCDKKTWKAPRALKNSKSGKFFCSKSCQTIWRNKYFSGEKHSNWKGGDNIEYRKLLIESNIKSICKVCGTKDKRVLIAHHRDKNHKNNKVENLIWLCLNCHHLVHNYNKSIK